MLPHSIVVYESGRLERCPSPFCHTGKQAHHLSVIGFKGRQDLIDHLIDR